MARPGGVRGRNKAIQLQTLARHSVGDATALEEDKWELRHLIEEYERICHIIDEADEMIEKLLPEIPCSDLASVFPFLQRLPYSHLAGTYVSCLTGISFCERLD
jgi:hypothetical protein